MTLSFNLGEEVEDLGYDFTTGKDGWDIKNGPGKGAVLEPTQESIRKYHLIRYKFLGLTLDADEAEFAEALKSINAEKAQQWDGVVDEAISALCQGHPSAKEIGALGVRARKAFIAFVMDRLNETVPTRPASATRPSLGLVKNA